MPNDNEPLLLFDIAESADPIHSDPQSWYEWRFLFQEAGYHNLLAEDRSPSPTSNVFSESFTSGPLFDAFVNSIAANYFAIALVDRKFGPGYDDWRWSIPSNSMKVIVTFYPPIQILDQRIEISSPPFTQSYGSISHWEDVAGTMKFNGYTAPHEFNFPIIIGATHAYRADTNLAVAPQQKYHHWNENQNDIVNHQTFGLLDVTANFKPAYNATIQTLLVENGDNAGTIRFRDPWLRDNNSDPKGIRNSGTQNAVMRSHESPFECFTAHAHYKGVFLGETPDPNNPEKPYYSVDAPSPQTISGFTSHFVNWSGNPTAIDYHDPNDQQTTVVFKQSGVVATALYKAHLGSSLASATGSNSQRLVAGMGLNGADDRYFMVYPSGGELWTNASLDNGATWSYETRITDGLGTSGAPSVALWTECTPGDSPNEDCDTELYTMYRKQSGSNYNIMFTTVLPFGSGVPASTQISSAAVPTSIDVRPVVARLVEGGEYHTMWAFWQNVDGIAYNYAERYGSTWNWVGEGLGFAGSFRNPSVSSVDLNVPTPTFSLAYDNATDVFVFNYPTFTVDGAVPASVSPVSYSPQVCADNRTAEQVHVVWEAYGGAELPHTDRGDSWEIDGAVQRRRVMYQQWSGSRWEAAHEFRNTNIDYQRPTLSNLANGHVAWAWDDGSSTYKALYDGSTWAVTEVYPSTTQPNLAISGSHGPIGTTRFVSTSTSGAPYQLTIGSETTGPMGGPQASVVPEQYSRRVVVARKPSHRVGRLRNSSVRSDGPTDEDSSSYVSVELAPITLKLRDGSIVSVDFAVVGDSVLDENAIWRGLISVPVTLSSTIDSVLVNGEAEAHAPLRLSGTEIGLSFDVVDADRGTVLKRIGTERIFSTNGTGSLVRRERLAGLAGRRVFIRPSVRGFVGRSAGLVSTFVHVHTLLVDSASQQAGLLAKASESSTSLPSTFALHQNFPNPFNPTTVIKYQLPEAQVVSLVVYDVLGRKIAELTDGYHAAGYHSDTWNAVDQASGVYFARFTVTSGAGEVKYSKVNKLVLMK